MPSSALARLGLLFAALQSHVFAAPAQDPAPVPGDTLITLERTACFGECPVYTITVDASGNVVYIGRKFVRVDGRQTARIAPARVAAILQEAERVGFFALDDQYRFVKNRDGSTDIVTDLPTTFLTIRVGGRSKRIDDYYGAPAGLKELERRVDGEAGSKRWVSLDARTLDRLVKEGWNPPAQELAGLLQNALREDDLEVIKGLLERGADPNGALDAPAVTPLMAVRSAAAAQLLLAAGASAAARLPNGFTPLYRATYLASDVTRVLLEAGARPDDPIDADGRTALWLAACAGNAGVVSVLLAAGPAPILPHQPQANPLSTARRRRAGSTGAPRGWRSIRNRHSKRISIASSRRWSRRSRSGGSFCWHAAETGRPPADLRVTRVTGWSSAVSLPSAGPWPPADGHMRLDRSSQPTR